MAEMVVGQTTLSTRPFHSVAGIHGSDVSPPRNTAADPIRDFYTKHPDPPPVENLDRARDEWNDEMRHRSEFHLFWPDKPYRGDIDILVAGCGTWQAAKYALCRPD